MTILPSSPVTLAASELASAGRGSSAGNAQAARPWYRQFWPWFIIALPAASVIASFATLYLAITRPDRVLPHEGDSNSYSAPADRGALRGAGQEGSASRAAAPDRGVSVAGDATGREQGASGGQAVQ